MRTLNPPIDPTHVANNTQHFAQPALQPGKVLDAQKSLWLTLKVTGAQQKTLAQNFLIIGEPFEEGGAIYSQIFNPKILNPYTPPTLVPLNSSDLCPNVKAMGPTGLAWQHVGDGEPEVRQWYAGVGAEAKDGRVLFNLHYKDAWEALFHEPVHEAAPGGGIGTSPRWIYEGYCEIFAKHLAQSMGFPYNIESGPYGEYSREVQKLIDFTAETYVARAYFTNDKWSYGLLAPLWYAKVMQHDISPSIATYIPKDVLEVPSDINDLLAPLKRKPLRAPDWYKRWVTLFGRSDQMPALQATAIASPFGPPPTSPPNLLSHTPPPMKTGPQSGVSSPPPFVGRGGSQPPTTPQVLQPVKPFSAATWAADH